MWKDAYVCTLHSEAGRWRVVLAANTLVTRCNMLDLLDTRNATQTSTFRPTISLTSLRLPVSHSCNRSRMNSSLEYLTTCRRPHKDVIIYKKKKHTCSKISDNKCGIKTSTTYTT
ncbi:hypothetical protein M758_UG270500 [Ceratodon purpureus]|nr:hypothetical protein M758_UG270500 [Ceratodon purpureus]